MSEPGDRCRVAQLVESLAPGGAETLAVSIAGALARRGHDSHLVVLRGDGPLRARIDPLVTLHDLARPHGPAGQVRRLARFVATSRLLGRLIRDGRIEVLQAHLPMANFLGLATAWSGGVATFPTVHNNREFDYGDNAGALKRAFRREGYRSMTQMCTGMVAVSDQVRASLAEQLKLSQGQISRIAVVRNGVPIPQVTSERARLSARTKLRLGGDQVVFLAAGRLTRQKNFGALLCALREIRSTDVDWRCIIAGEGELRPELEERIRAFGLADRVELLGLVADMQELFAAADVFCMTSLFEGLPLVLLEAMASGLPVAAFGIDGVVDVVSDGTEALIAPPGDIDRLATALAALASDGPRRRQLGECGRRRVAEHFNFEATVDALEGLYRSAVRSAS
jgi:glycosyltransferase involved in cell wall biosynthesis